MAHNYCECGGNKGSCIDCAEEEIDRLTAQLAERDAEISDCNKFNFELQQANATLRKEVATLRQQSINWVPVFDANMELQTENAALRKEVERLKNPIVDAPAAYENGRKQTAQDIADWLRDDIYNIESKYLQNSKYKAILFFVSDELRQRYGLEG